MDLFQLTYFIEVAHKKSFTKASHSLHISPLSVRVSRPWKTTGKYSCLTERESTWS